MRRRRIILLATASIVMLLGVTCSGWLAVQRQADPLETLRRDPGEVTVVADSSYPIMTAAGERRMFRDLTLATERAGEIRVTTSRPAAGPAPALSASDASAAEGGSAAAAAPAERLPLVVILAGLRTGRESLALVPSHGPNLLVGYQYPYDQETWYQSAKVTQIPSIRRAVLNVPWQVAYVADRLRSEPYVDPGRTALLGYSFGALFVPATQRLAAEVGRPFDAGILAFGGVDIQGLMEANLKVGSATLRRSVGWLVATLLHAVEPELHLPHATGRFLVIRGTADRRIPPELSARLAELTPEPREIITLETGHMNPRNPELTDRVVRISQDWLVREGVIEPADAR